MGFAEAAELYRLSWEAAPARAYGRLVGMLKAAIIAGDGSSAADYAMRELSDDFDSPTAAYAVAIAATVQADLTVAGRAAAQVSAEPGAFGRAGRALAALAGGDDDDAFARAVAEIRADFSARDSHLTGVPIADTAIMLESLAQL